MLEVLDPGKRTVLFDDVLFFHRPRQPQDADPIAYLEAEIAGLLGAQESLSDVLYRYRETVDGYLIGLARRSAIQGRRPDPLVVCRIPHAVALWQRFEQIQPQAAPMALLYVRDFDHHYILTGDRTGLCRVAKLKPTHRLGYDVYSAVERACQLRPDLRENKRLYCAGEIPEFTRAALLERHVEIVQIVLPKRQQLDPALLQEWDFRLPREVEAQMRFHEVVKTIRVAAISAGVILSVIAILFAMERGLAWQSGKSRLVWQSLQSSLREMNFLRTQNMNQISELAMGVQLSGIRTGHAAVLQVLAATRPAPVRLEQLTLAPYRQRVAGGDSTPVVVYRLELKGLCGAAGPISAWMAALSASPQLAGVKLISVERRGEEHAFRMECDVAGLDPKARGQ